ncbi:hypothetical protein D8890_06110 [Streptococcus sanguinis]|mgnify:FL=1|jgi:hypothetical protein|uniref:PoNe immunity protein domain-containing protein n=1 Tax=Streptococcus TaxID=1301 RepID=UPI0006607E73|nr:MULTISPECIES: PoNe immunity protein domain-containing protein [Streptococcus]MDN5011225.1 DUF1911 domain-containing protein [Streptococcus sp. SN3]RSI05228.1 hypothetical protein D8890_06110 [Streptococcus sanguinis]
MELRDTFSDRNNIDGLINIFQKAIQDSEERIQGIEQDEKEGVQKFSLDNMVVISNIRSSIFRYQKEIMIATYTAGYSLEKFKSEYIKYIKNMKLSWHSNSGYEQMVWALSIGIMLDIDEAIFDQIVDLVKKDDPEDYLIDYLIQSRQPDWKIRINYNFPRPYGFTRKIIEEENTEQALKLLKEYLTKKWYQGSKDTGWHDLHKTNNKSYYSYWSFESGAICKIKGLDYKELEGVPYFPYDLVAEGAKD